MQPFVQRIVLLVLLSLGLSLPAFAGLQEPPPAAPPAQTASPVPEDARVGFPERWLVLDAIDGRGRRPFRPDHVFARYLWRPAAQPPVAGESLAGELGEDAWSVVETTEDERAVRGAGWAYTTVEVDAARVVLAKLAGASTLFVNGAGFTGDVYRYGFGGVPVALSEGTNHLFVTGIRGAFELTFDELDPGVAVAAWDATVPDLVFGAPLPESAGLLVFNATTETAPGVRAALVPAGTEVEGHEAALTRRSSARDLAPLAIAKLPAPLVVPRDFRLPSGTGMEWRGVALSEPERQSGAPSVGSATFELALRPKGETHRRTLRSRVDGSIQEWALVPPGGGRPPEGGFGLILSLHGASVTSLRQANCYTSKPDLWVAAPMNRRPFGFDWQDWGRLDAYEVLAAAQAASGVSDERLYLTGHSMGGHGTWHLAANDPDRFAAIAPSAGWESFDTYGGRPEGELRELWHRADGTSLTRELLTNLAQVPTYVLHGTDDETVSRAQADGMLAALEELGVEPERHFQEGAGHWWGNACVDWPPIADFFRERRRARDPLELDFLTVDPVIDSEHHWLRALQPREYGRPMRLVARFEPTSGVLTLETENAGAFRVEPPESWHIERYEIDGRRFETIGVLDRGLFRFDGGSWRRGRPPEGEKGPGRAGPFKRAFDHGFVLVYGTQGDARETAELLARARYDAAVWCYRGNGLAPLASDASFVAGLAAGDFADCNVILYGNRDTNAAWTRVVPGDCPIRAERGKLALGEQRYEGEALGAVFVYPRAGSSDRLVGVFADSGVAGTRLGYTLAPFVSGVGYPDYALFSGEVLGSGDPGVHAAGWFDRAWGLASAEEPR